MARNARESGITAITLTTDSVDFAATLRRMATWEREINEAPDTFMRVHAVADLLEAKRTSRLGIIHGLVGINGDLANVAPLAAFGARIVQLTCNVRTLAGDGSLATGNAGVSSWGACAGSGCARWGWTASGSRGTCPTSTASTAWTRRPSWRRWRRWWWRGPCPQQGGGKQVGWSGSFGVRPACAARGRPDCG